ncbi:MAG: cell division protein ZipA [Granulosicoccus sp.]|nr:cell division protein ZipA [Granulosicoccus sp.]
MENLRWILIAAGVAILVLLYFSGRPRRAPGRTDHRRIDEADRDSQDFDMNLQRRSGRGADHDPLLGGEPVTDHYTGFDDIDPDDLARPASSAPSAPFSRGPAPDYDYEFEDLATGDKSGGSSGFSSFTQKFEAFSERLSPRRRKLVAQSEPAELDEETASDPKYASKIVTLHVVAPPDSVIQGEHLLSVFENRGYHFGEMNIFHSMHEGTTVFSVAKMIEPGFFDINDLDSFDTPGITLILQLPGPVPADVSFEVLVSEAYEMARELNGTVLDEHRSNLTKQTVQHLREGIYEYMHRQKYFGTVPS